MAQTALKTAAVRMPDREACAAELAAAMDRSPAATKIVLLEILGAVGGTKALAAVGAAAKSSDPALQDVSSRLLGEWMTIDAAPVLLDLAKDRAANTRPARSAATSASRGSSPCPTKQRVEMCKNAFEAARQPAEQKLVLDVLKRYPNLEMLKLAANAAKIPDVKDDATAACRAISQKLGPNDEVREVLTKAGLEK